MFLGLISMADDHVSVTDQSRHVAHCHVFVG